MKRDPTKGIAFTKIQGAKPCLANLRGILKDSVEDRFEVARRGTNNPEYIGGGRLLLKRFAQFVEQPRVLDSDDGLGSEVLHQLNLLVGERPHLLAHNVDHANEFVISQHWYAERSSESAKFNGIYECWMMFDVRLQVPQIGDMDDLLSG